MGGDTDTIGSMAGAIAGAFCGASAIPEALVRKCEGTADAAEQAERFFEASQKRGEKKQDDDDEAKMRRKEGQD